jgi:hypothetical protein
MHWQYSSRYPDWIASAPSFDARTERLPNSVWATTAQSDSGIPTNLERRFDDGILQVLTGAIHLHSGARIYGTII